MMLPSLASARMRLRPTLRFIRAAALSCLPLVSTMVASNAQTAGDYRIVTQVPHTNIISAVDFSPDGSRLLTGSFDNSLQLWDLQAGRVFQYLSGHNNSVQAAAFLPDGLSVVSADQDGFVKIWDIRSGRERGTFRGSSANINSLAVSRDGSRIATGGDAIRIWEPGGRLVRTLDEGRGYERSITSVAFNPDGRAVLAGARDGSVKLWSVSDARLLRSYTELAGGASPVIASISPDGRRVAAVTQGPTQNLIVWETSTGRIINRLELAFVSPKTISFAPDGASVFVGGSVKRDAPVFFGGSIVRFNYETGQQLQTYDLPLEMGSLSTSDISADGSRLIAVGGQGQAIWDPRTGMQMQSLGGPQVDGGYGRDGIASAFAPSGTDLVWAGSDSARRVWNLIDGSLTSAAGRVQDGVSRGIAGRLASLYVANGSNIMSPDYRAELASLSDGKTLGSFQGSGFAWAADVSRDGRLVWVHSVQPRAPSRMRLWEVASGRLLSETETDLRTMAMRIAPDNSHGVSASFRDGTLNVWNLASGKVVRTIGRHPGAGSFVKAQSITFSPDGKQVVTGGERTVEIRDFNTGRVVRTLQAHESRVNVVEFSPDGRLLTAGVDRTAKLWNAVTGQLLRTFSGHSHSVNAAGFSLDGSRVFTAASDRTIRVWDTHTGHLLITFYANSDNEWITITPEGFFNASANGSALLTLVKDLQVLSADQVFQTLFRPDLVREKLAGDPNGKVKQAAAGMDLARILATGAPPEVRIGSVTVNSTKEVASVAATLVDRGGGIGRLEWRVNGTAVGVDTPNAEASGGPIQVLRELALEAGANTIELVAYNRSNLVASTPGGVSVEGNQDIARAKPRLFVVAAGINNYWDSRLKLSYAVPDAKAVTSAFSKGAENLYGSVETITLLDSDVVAEKLEQTLSTLARRMRPSDAFVFFLAGHGKTVDGKYYFIPWDFRYENEESIQRKAIGQDQLQSLLAMIPARKSVLLFDTCESGSLTVDPRSTRGLELVVAVERMTRAMGRTVIAASTHDAVAHEGYKGHGVFSFALLEGFANADAGADGVISVTQLASFIDRRVPEISYEAFRERQVPQLKIQGSDFPLVVRLNTPPTGDADSVPSRPTHVVIRNAEVFVEAGSAGRAVAELPPGTPVFAVDHANGWTLVGRGGRRLGYVQSDVLLKLQ